MEGYVRKRGVRLGLYLCLLFALLTGVYLLRDIFAPLFVGLLIAYILDPVADALERIRVGRLRLNRFAAVSVIFLVAVLFVAGVLATSGYFVARWARGLSSDVLGETAQREKPDPSTGWIYDPDYQLWFADGDGDGHFRAGYIHMLRRRVETLAAEHAWGQELKRFLETDVKRFVEERLERDNLEKLARAILERTATWISGGTSKEDAGPSRDDGGGGGGVFRFLSWLILCPVYAFFGLLQIDAIVARVRSYLPGRQRARIERIFSRIERTLASFFRGRLLVCLAKGALTAGGLWLLGVDYWAPIGFAAGFLGLIPVVGVPLALVPALILSWIEASSWGRLAGISVLFVAMEGVEGTVLIPTFLGKEVGLSPITILVTLLIFGKLFGFIGILLSVPLAAVSKILAEEFVFPILEEFAAEPRAPPSEPRS